VPNEFLIQPINCGPHPDRSGWMRCSGTLTDPAGIDVQKLDCRIDTDVRLVCFITIPEFHILDNDATYTLVPSIQPVQDITAASCR
jgi:hypothetical protein